MPFLGLRTETKIKVCHTLIPLYIKLEKTQKRAISVSIYKSGCPSKAHLQVMITIKSSPFKNHQSAYVKIQNKLLQQKM
jgi:hypothetical protein